MRFVFPLAAVVLVAGCGVDSSSAAGSGGALAGGGTKASGGTGNAGAGGATTGGEGGGTGTGGSTAFTCTQASASSPVLAANVLVDPADPHPGDTLTVVIKATDGTTSADAPEMDLAVTTASGTANYSKQLLLGGPAVYVYEVPNLALGDVCLLSRISGQPEASGKVTVTPRGPGPAGASGIYKVTTNHQLTCEEQPDWGNELHVSVRDASGQGVPNAAVSVRLPDWTDTDTIKNASSHAVPVLLSTDENGNYDDYFWWPSNGNGFTVFELSVKNAASDRATEITSGWWDTDPDGCRYCPDYPTRNVYGHWSHRVVFRLDTAATDICVVPTDHAGQSACGTPGHIQHAPDASACWPGK